MSTPNDSDRVFKALASGSRRKILDSLKAGPLTTGALCDAFPELDRCTVMQHLKVLEDADLVVAQKKGRERWNHLNPLPIRDMHDRWIAGYTTHAVDMLNRLKRGLEG
jgi:DNA-binding transcriptional ArsR family regulator